MGRIATITRRSFLVGSAAIGGGVAFGTFAVNAPHSNPLETTLRDGEATFNAWVKVDSDKITLITPHADIGQGVVSMQAAMIAEELDVDWGDFEVESGQPAPAYYNTAMGGELVPFRSFDQGRQAQTMRTVANSAIKLFGLQGTGGSSSVPDSYDKLRAAGAVARETFKLAASKKTGIAVDQLKTANGAVHLPDGSKITYPELAAECSRCEPVTDVALRDPSQWRLLGKPMQRLDILGKSTGSLDYTIDLHLDGMVNASVKTNPRNHGTMNGFDASAAEGMPGVQKIVEVNQVTQGVAVIADNTWNAIQALEAIDYDWGPAPYPHEQSEHWATVEASFTEERLDSEWVNDGDVVAANGDSPHSAEYRAPYVAHQPLEPMSAIVKVTDDAVEVWTGHQIPGFLLMKVGAITGHDRDQITLHQQYAGGSFGHRLEFTHVELAAEIANQMRGTPVKLTYSREEDFIHDYNRQIGMARASGAVKDGHIDSIDIEVATVSSSASQSSRLGQSQPGPDSQIVSGVWNNAYSIDNFRVRAYRVPELAPTSSWRSVGASTGGFFLDCFIDELCHLAGADPLAERLRLASNESTRATLEAVGEMSNWGADLGPNRGRGIAFVESFGVPTAEVVEVTATEDGIKIDKVFVAADVGRVVDPVNFENLVQGGVVWGLGHAMNCEITFTDGIADQDNFHAHEGMRMHQCPEIHVRGIEVQKQIRGIGEPPVPPAAPALANAIFAATGQRIREMPLWNHVDFV